MVTIVATMVIVTMVLVVLSTVLVSIIMVMLLAVVTVLMHAAGNAVGVHVASDSCRARRHLSVATRPHSTEMSVAQYTSTSLVPDHLSGSDSMEAYTQKRRVSKVQMRSRSNVL